MLHESKVGISKYYNIHWVTALQTKYVKNGYQPHIKRGVWNVV